MGDTITQKMGRIHLRPIFLCAPLPHTIPTGFTDFF